MQYHFNNNHKNYLIRKKWVQWDQCAHFNKIVLNPREVNELYNIRPISNSMQEYFLVNKEYFLVNEFAIEEIHAEKEDTRQRHKENDS